MIIGYEASNHAKRLVIVCSERIKKGHEDLAASRRDVEVLTHLLMSKKLVSRWAILSVDKIDIWHADCPLPNLEKLNPPSVLDSLEVVRDPMSDNFFEQRRA